ncbi:MAG: NAD-dependent epimerase/dehydratase family protein [Victivallales bacterium]
MEKILITGGAGYLGSILVPVLLENQYKVTVLDNLLYRQNSLLDCCSNPNFDIIRGDCRDEALLKKILPAFDVFFPLAALVGAPLCAQDPIGAVTTNRDAVLLLDKLRSKNQRIIIPITNSGYGIGAKDKFCTEESPLNPISLYGRSKVEAETAVLASGNAISLRLATVFGASPRMRTDLLVNDFVYRAVYDRAVILFEAHAKRNYIHVRDVARAFLHVLKNFDRMNGAYNVGLSSANLSKAELCRNIQKHIPGFVFHESEIGEDPDKRDYIVSNEKIEKTGFQPEHSLDDGILELKKVFTIIKNNQYANV